MAELLFKEEVYELVGAAMRVYNELGSGFLEAVYQEAYEIECADSNVPVKPRQEIQIKYRGRTLKKRYVADILAYGGIVVELKVCQEFSKIEIAQLINYLKATGKRVGVLISFGNHDELKWQRFAV
jgi:GxxExxY protein